MTSLETVERPDGEDVLRHLVERRYLIGQMQDTEGWKLWGDFLAAVAGAYQDRLIHARHTDLMEQRRDAGVLEGIRIALTAVDRLDGMISAHRRMLSESSFADMEETA
jgi:hypothetical protein